MKYRVVEYYSYFAKKLWFRVESKENWFFLWYVERSYDTKEEAISHIEKMKANKQKVVYVSN